MTEEEWLACEDNPSEMIQAVKGRASERKARLFCCACCRRVWPHLRSTKSEKAVELLEQYLDGPVPKANLDRAREEAYGDLENVLSSIPGYQPEVHSDSHPPEVDSPLRAAVKALDAVYYAMADCGGASTEEVSESAWSYCAEMTSMRGHDCIFDATYRQEPAKHNYYLQLARAALRSERVVQVKLLRDILGTLPFRPLRVEPLWLSSTVVSLAKVIYEDRELPSGLLDTGSLAILADALEDAGCDNSEVLSHCRGPGPHTRGCWVVDLLLGKE